MSLRKRVEKIEGDIYRQYWPFSGEVMKRSMDERIKDLEKENDHLWDNLNALLNYFNLERELVREHLKLKKKK